MKNALLKEKDEVFVTWNGCRIGAGTIEAACGSEAQLLRFFEKSHPMFGAYRLAVENGKKVYVVDFAGEGGRGGYFEKSLQKRSMR